VHVSNSTFWDLHFHLQVCLDPSTLKVHNNRNSNICEPLFLQKGVTPHENSRNFWVEERYQLQSIPLSKVLQWYPAHYFFNFFSNFFFGKYEIRRKMTVLGGGETIALNPAQIDFFLICSSQILHVSKWFRVIRSHSETFRVI